MPEHPEKEVLLDAVARFIEELRPLIPDARLAFRALIAANLTTIVTTELKHDEARTNAELAGLRALQPNVAFPANDAATLAEKRTEIEARDHALAERLRNAAVDENELALIRTHIVQSLIDSLRISNPRFDLRAEIE